MKRLILYVLVLLLLAACSTDTATQPPQNPAPSGTTFDAYVTSVSQDMQAVLAKTAGLNMLANLPAGTPAGDLDALSSLSTLQIGDSPLELFSSLSYLDLEALNAAAFAYIPGTSPNLPRGAYSFDTESDSWVKTAESDDLILSYFSEAESANATVRFDWNGGAATVRARSFGGAEVEVPTSTIIAFSSEGTDLGSLNLTSNWFDACGYRILELTSLSLIGELTDTSKQQQLGVQVEVNVSNDPYTRDTVSASAAISYEAGSDSAALNVGVSESIDIARDEACYTERLTVYNGQLDAELNVVLDGETADLALNASHGNLVPAEDGALALIDVSGTVTAAGAETASFTGVLDDANSNGIPGENILLTYQDGSSSTLEALLNSD